MSILVTGGAGYIGSHTCRTTKCWHGWHGIVVLDNLLNSKPEALDQIIEITEKELKFYQADLLNKKDISTIFSVK